MMTQATGYVLAILLGAAVPAILGTFVVAWMHHHDYGVPFWTAFRVLVRFLTTGDPRARR